MKKETVDALLNNMTSIVGIIRDVHIEVTALIQAVQEHQPTLFEVYRKKLQSVAQDPRVAFDVAGIASLRAILLQDQS